MKILAYTWLLLASVSVLSAWFLAGAKKEREPYSIDTALEVTFECVCIGLFCGRVLGWW
jgi:hypothetical protein